MYDLILYDTSNFVDFPIGGQITSIRNFLKYLANRKKEFCAHILLVGISTKKKDIGKIKKVKIDNVEFDFLPVLYREENLTSVKKSLRIEYLKALIKKRKSIVAKKKSVHYIHTPEAFIGVKMIYPKAKTVVFSHGSFFNMVAGFRFYQNNKIVHWLFNHVIIYLLKKADLIFTLDETSTKQYLNYTKKVVRVENSIILPEVRKKRMSCHRPIRLLFVGRLSKVKRVGEIIETIALMNGNAVLTVVGDGEEYPYLKQKIREYNLGDYIKLEGAVPPQNIGQYMEDNDILVMNSKFEGKPMTILEALSYGMPVITTPVGGIKEMTENGKNSVYTNGKKEQIKDAILKIVEKYSDYEENAFLGSEKFDYKVVNKKIFIELMNQLGK